MTKRLEQVNENDLKNLIVETRTCFSQLVYRLDGFRDNMKGGFDDLRMGFDDLSYLLNELNYRI